MRPSSASDDSSGVNTVMTDTAQAQALGRFEDEGWRVDACPDGFKAREKIESDTEYDLLLLDSELPEVNGIELVRIARGLINRRYTPIIVLSTTEMGREAQRRVRDHFLGPQHLMRYVDLIGRLLKP